MRFEELERHDRHIPLILKLDVSGQPVRWISWQDAVTAAWTDKIIWKLGNPITLHGGIGREGVQSTFDLHPIIACNDQTVMKDNKPMTLTNRGLFRRDQHLCLYCGNEFPPSKLTRDHVIPVSKGGPNTWTNTVSSCSRCNMHKADRTPEEAGMKLLAVPYAPNRAESLILANRRIITDQMDYLKSMIPASSRFWKSQ